MAKKVILSLDQGTTSSRAVVFDHNGNILGSKNHEFTQIFPKPGWVEHDPGEIWSTTVRAIGDALKLAGVKGDQVAAIGITNQRETTVVWDRATGKPVYNAIVWQCRRTADVCEQLKKKGLEKPVRQKTGLVVDAYFSGTKVKWILDHVKGARKAAEKGALAFGTIDTWLLWNLTAGAVHATEPSNAARTMLLNIRTMKWDAEILKALDIPAAILPEVKDSSGVFGVTRGVKGLPDGIPVAGIAGDQQAALFGQTCFDPGQSKCTYGTGGFLLLNTGSKFVASRNKLLTTVAWKIGKETTYALEGSVFICGAVIQWLRDGLQILSKASESEAMARSVSDTGGVYLVPAFVGLGAPHWDMYARGALFGLTRGTTRAHIVRAALESMAFQTRDLARAMEADAGLKLKTLNVDGGAVANDFLTQFQADVLGVSVNRPKIIETTAVGAALLAGLGTGYWKSLNELRKVRQTQKIFKPAMKPAERAALCAGWEKAVERSKNWVDK